MSASANALASLTFAVPARVEAVTTLLRSAPEGSRQGRALPSGSGLLARAGSAAAGTEPTTGTAPDSGATTGLRMTPALATAAAHIVIQGGLHGAAASGDPVHIGRLGRAIAAALPAAAQGAADAPLQLPEIDVAAHDVARFAPALARAVVNSGLSYEAHLQDWVAGRRTLDEVLAEPYARPGALGVAAAAVAVPAAQLRCIETGELLVAFQAWPGQPCELLLRPDDHHHASPQGELAELQGDGRLTLTLPQLGRVQARLRTAGNQVQLTLHAASTDAAQQFNGATAALAFGLGTSGLKLVSVVVHEPDA